MFDSHLDISKPEYLEKALEKVFESTEVKTILEAAAQPEIKGQLAQMTETVVKKFGAFGCPWFWVYDGKGNAEPFFGSDRFHFMWDYLEIPHRDLELNVNSSKL